MSEVKAIPYNKHPLNHRCDNDSCGRLIDVLNSIIVFTKDGTKRFCSRDCRNVWLNNYIGKDDL